MFVKSGGENIIPENKCNGEIGNVETHLGALQTSVIGNIGKIVKELTTIIISM